ncbi:unnamed protein product [Brassica oleracea]
MEDEEWEKICRICLNPEKPGGNTNLGEFIPKTPT